MIKIDKIISYLFYALFFFVPLILWPYNSELFELNKMVLVYVLTTLITCSWIIKMVNQRKFIFSRTIIDIPLIVFLLSQLISTIISIDPRTSLLGYYSRFNGGLLSSICYSLLYWAYVSNMDKEKSLVSFRFLVSSGILVCIYGILEHFGIDKNIWVQDVQNRVFSTLGQPNWLAAWIIVLVPIVWVNTLKEKLSNKKFWLNLLISLGFFITLLFTKSRSGILGFAVIEIIFWAIVFKLNFKDKKCLVNVLKKFTVIQLTTFFLILLIGTPWTPNLAKIIKKTPPAAQTTPTGPALEVGGTESGEIRKIVWKGAINIWKHYPVFGSGVETFAYSYPKFRPQEHNLVSEWDFLYNKAHNEYLNIMATTGTLGILSYLFLIGSFIYLISKNLFKQTKLLKDEDDINYLPAFLAGIISILVTNFFGFSVVPTQIELFLIPAIAVTFLINNDLLIKKSIVTNKNKKKNISQPNLDWIIWVAVITSCFFIYLIIKFWYADILFC